MYSHTLLAAPTRAPSPLVFEDKLGGGEGVGGGADGCNELGEAVYPQVARALGYSWLTAALDGSLSIYPEVARSLHLQLHAQPPSAPSNNDSRDVPRPSWALERPSSAATPASASASALRVSRVDSGEDLSLLCSIIQVRTHAHTRGSCVPVTSRAL